jgi:hypothetical protein
MKKMILTSLIAVAALSFASMNYASGPDYVEKTSSLKGRTSDGVPITFEIIIRQYPSGTPQKNRWGVSPRHPRVKPYISDLRARFGDEIVALRLSAYYDLADPDSFSLEYTENSYHLIIRGGSAGSAYEARLTFEGEYLKKRKVSLSEFRDVAWEETVYSYNTLDL